MKRIRRWLLVLLMLCLLILSIGFSLLNAELVPLSLGVVSFDPRPLSVWMVLAFSCGALTGLLLGAGLIRHVRLRQRIQQLENELEKRPTYSRAERD